MRQEGITGIYRGLWPTVSCAGPYCDTRITLCTDDATRRQFRCSLHDIFDTEAVCPRGSSSRTNTTQYHYLWHRCHCRASNGLHDHASGVGSSYDLLIKIFILDQCHQDSHAVIRSAFAVSQFCPLCVSDIYRGGDPEVLDRDYPKAGSVGGK